MPKQLFIINKLKNIPVVKKIFSILALAATLLAVDVAHAQGSIHAGYVQNNLISSYTVPVVNTTIHDTLTRPGIYAGFGYNVRLVDNLGLNVGANIEYFCKNDSNSLYYTKFRQLDLVVPIYLNFAIPFGGNNSFTIFAGPTLNLGLINKSTNTDRLSGTVTEYNYFDTQNATEESYYRERFTWALTGGVRVNFGGFGIHAGYTYGMSDNFTSANVKGTCKRIFIGASLSL